MKTIRITRQNFPNHGNCSWLSYFEFVLSKKYNVLIDSQNPDIVFHSNLYSSGTDIDKCTGQMPPQFTEEQAKNIKFVFISGEMSDFRSSLTADNRWAIGYEKFEHPRYLRQPSGVLDVWTLFDESRLVDSPLNWLTEKRNFDVISKRNTGFCSITQASSNEIRNIIFDKLSEYKQVTSSGPWRQNIFDGDTLNKWQWMDSVFVGRCDGLTYREKMEFFMKYKFNMSIHFGDTDYILQEKIYHAFFSGAIPIFYGNKCILQEGFNPEAFINVHEYKDNLDEFLNLVKRIDTDNDLYRKYIEAPIFVDNKLPEYYNFDYVLNFLDKVIEA
jgi:hypothetical protein